MGQKKNTINIKFSRANTTDEQKHYFGVFEQ